jgi:hypothetical protein
MNEELITRLSNVAGKLRQLWGANDDSNTIDEAIEALKTPTATPTPAQTKKVTK